jgi:polysaccharide biosynthesis/export protein
MLKWRSLFFSLGLGVTAVALAQPPQPAQAVPAAPKLIESVRPDYELGPNDQVLIGVPQAQEIDQRPYRIDSDGNIDLPLVGKVHAAGLTVRGLENVLAGRLRDYIREPQVTITITQFRSEPVFFIGSFKTPGIYPLQGNHTLVEMLAAVGGLEPTASRRITVTRRDEYGGIDLPNAIHDPARKVSTVVVSLDSLTRNINPAEDIVLKAYDIVSAENEKPVFVSGEVVKPGPIPLNEEPSISVTQVLSQAGGLTGAGSRHKIRVLRPILGTSRRAEIDVDLSRIYAGKDNDFPLLPGDVLYVPRATFRATMAPVGTAILTTAPYLIVTLAIAGLL